MAETEPVQRATAARLSLFRSTRLNSVRAGLFAIWLIFGAGLFTPSAATEPEQALAELNEDLQAALKRLAVVQQQVADEKAPLTRRLQELESQLRQKRQALDIAGAQQRFGDQELTSLASEIRDLREDDRVLSGLLSNYRADLESSLHLAERPAFADSTPESEDENPLWSLELGVGRLERLIGGGVVPGEAYDVDGELHSGTYGLIGPVAVFAGESGALAGPVLPPSGDLLHPLLRPADGADAQAIRGVLQSGSGMLPLDPTVTEAVRAGELRYGLIEEVRRGGLVMIPIVLLGILAGAISVVKTLQLSRHRMADGSLIDDVGVAMHEGNPDRALDRTAQLGGAVGSLLNDLIQSWRASPTLLEELVTTRMIEAKIRLERFLPWVTLTAAVAPLLGLLGTVTGMINTFKLITVYGTGDPKVLSSGIHEALITTKFGLIIAVLALAASALLRRRTRAVLDNMEHSGAVLITQHGEANH